MSFLKNRTVIGVVCILLSLIICFVVTPLFNQSMSERAAIVRVVKPVEKGGSDHGRKSKRSRGRQL